MASYLGPLSARRSYKSLWKFHKNTLVFFNFWKHTLSFWWPNQMDLEIKKKKIQKKGGEVVEGGAPAGRR